MHPGLTDAYEAWRGNRRVPNKYGYEYTIVCICLRFCTDASTDIREKIWYTVLTLRHMRLARASARVFVKCWKKPTRAHPCVSFSLTDRGPENQPGGSVSSLCGRGRESPNEQEPQTVLAGGRASMVARSPLLAA
jgi:hypothetical protein